MARPAANRNHMKPGNRRVRVHTCLRNGCHAGGWDDRKPVISPCRTNPAVMMTAKIKAATSQLGAQGARLFKASMLRQRTLAHFFPAARESKRKGRTPKKHPAFLSLPAWKEA